MVFAAAITCRDPSSPVARIDTYVVLTMPRHILHVSVAYVVLRVSRHFEFGLPVRACCKWSLTANAAPLVLLWAG